MRFGHPLRDRWLLDPDVTYLNHGTVGATPRAVLTAQQALRDEMERQPSRFMLREVSNWIGADAGHPTRMREAAAGVARFVGARPDDVVFVDNATAGVNAVLRSMILAPDDEIVVTDHTYGAVAKAADFVARRAGARVVVATLPFPRFDAVAAVDAIEAALTPRTRLAIVDHVVSETALLLPVRDVVARCRERGVPVLVDGAHAPGAIELDVDAVDADWYTANLHKWAHAPRSCGILWARPERQGDLHPTVISWGLEEGFTREFDWVGTRDPTPWLAAPAGIAFLESLGWDAVRRHNHDLAWHAATSLTRRWQTPLEIDESSVGTMAAVPLPAAAGSTDAEARRLRDALLFEDRIEVAAFARAGRLWVRVSAQVYNDEGDIDRLASAVLARL
jgi:isopenicillin-N epimerase